MTSEFLTFEETANALGVSTRHARRLADSGAVNRIARGLVDRDSVDRYLCSQHQGRTRSWAEHTAWGAAALLSGGDAGWLGATQASRLRATLRELDDDEVLLTRMRDRSRVHTYMAHPAAHSRLRELIIPSNYGLVGMADASAAQVDGYLPEADLDAVVHAHALRADASGIVVLRTTGFDVDQVRALVATPTVAALDAATSTDPRLRGVGRRALVEQLKSLRVHARRRGTIDDMARTPQGGEASLSGRVGRLVRAHRAELLAVLAKHGVTNAEIFGSAARGDEHEGSDLDLLVDLAPSTDLFDLVRIKAELEEVLGAPVDLIPRDGLKDRVRVAAEKDLVPL